MLIVSFFVVNNILFTPDIRRQPVSCSDKHPYVNISSMGNIPVTDQAAIRMAAPCLHKIKNPRFSKTRMYKGRCNRLSKLGFTRTAQMVKWEFCAYPRLPIHTWTRGVLLPELFQPLPKCRRLKGGG